MALTFTRLYFQTTVAATKALTRLATVVPPAAVPSTGERNSSGGLEDSYGVPSATDTPDVDPADPLSPTASSVLEVLAEDKSRAVLTDVLTADGPRTIEELTTVLAEREGYDCRTCQITLTHTTLPKLAERGLIVWDVEEGTVRLPDEQTPTVAFQELSELLEAYHRESR